MTFENVSQRLLQMKMRMEHVDRLVSELKLSLKEKMLARTERAREPEKGSGEGPRARARERATHRQIQLMG